MLCMTKYYLDRFPTPSESPIKFGKTKLGDYKQVS